MIAFGISPARCLAGLFLFSATLTACSPQCTPHTKNLANRVVLQVDEDTLSSKAFAAQLAERLRDYDALAVKDEHILNQAKQEIIRDFILKTLTERWARQNDVLLKKEDLDARIQEIRRQYPDDLTFRQKLIEENLTYDDWHARLKFSLLQKLVAQKLVESATPPSDEELRGYYESNKALFNRDRQLKLRQIVVKTENDAKTLLDEIKSGKKLESFAPTFSIGPEGKSGGDLGWIEVGTLEVFDQLFDKNVGYLSGVLKSPYGYHIIQVLDKRAAATLSFEDVKKTIYNSLMQNREDAAYSKWLETEIRKTKVLKDEAFLENIRIETRGEN